MEVLRRRMTWTIMRRRSWISECIEAREYLDERDSKTKKRLAWPMGTRTRQ